MSLPGSSLTCGCNVAYYGQRCRFHSEIARTHRPTAQEPPLDSSRDLRIHLRSWDDGQAALCRTLLSVAPFVDHAGLVAVIENLLGEPSQTSASVDDLPADRAASPTAHSDGSSRG